jgi:hypothetical protein
MTGNSWVLVTTRRFSVSLNFLTSESAQHHSLIYACNSSGRCFFIILFTEKPQVVMKINLVYNVSRGPDNATSTKRHLLYWNRTFLCVNECFSSHQTVSASELIEVAKLVCSVENAC